MKVILLGLALLATAALPASACSVSSDYRVPTNVELIDAADLVVLARVVALETPAEGPEGEPYFQRVILKPVRAIKGEAPAELKVWGFFDLRGVRFPLYPTALDEVHSTVLMGGCVRLGYAQDALVVAMFERREGEYIGLEYPFARNVEDVEGASSLWVRAADQYAALLARTQGAERRAAFEAERDALRAQAGDKDAQAMADDIARYLAVTVAP